MAEQTEREFLHEVTNVFSVAHGTLNLLLTLYRKNSGLEKNDHNDEHFRKACRALEQMREMVTTRHEYLRQKDRRK